MSPIATRTQEIPKITSNNRIISPIGGNRNGPDNADATMTASEASDVKHPPRRLKSSTLRRKALSALERTIGKSSARKIEEYEGQDRVPRDRLWCRSQGKKVPDTISPKRYLTPFLLTPFLLTPFLLTPFLPDTISP